MQVWPVAAKMPEIDAGRRGSSGRHRRRRCWATCRRVRARRASICARGRLVDLRARRVRAGEGDLGDVRDARRARCRSRAPKPVTTLNMPSGSPASLVSAANSSVLAEANSDGLTTTAQPAASAGAHFQATNSSGEFQAVSAADDADRLVRVNAKVSGLSIGTCAPSTLSARPREVPPPFRLVAGLAVHLGEQLAVVAHLDFGEAPSRRARRDRRSGAAPCRGPRRSWSPRALPTWRAWRPPPPGRHRPGEARGMRAQGSPR